MHTPSIIFNTFTHCMLVNAIHFSIHCDQQNFYLGWKHNVPVVIEYISQTTPVSVLGQGRVLCRFVKADAVFKTYTPLEMIIQITFMSREPSPLLHSIQTAPSVHYILLFTLFVLNICLSSHHPQCSCVSPAIFVCLYTQLYCGH